MRTEGDARCCISALTAGHINQNDRDLTSNVATAKAQEYLRKRDKQRQHVVTEAKPLNDNFLVEPNLEYVLQALVPKLLNLMVYTALLDSIASEHAARMVAMQTATDNGNEILQELTLEYNKNRQQKITSELLDTVYILSIITLGSSSSSNVFTSGSTI